MATKSSIIPTSSICQGCLSVDRKLTAVSDVESAKIFCDILDPLDLINCPISLCWECASLMRRMIVFKEQIKQAHKSLVKYTVNNTSTLPALSKLTKTSVRHQHDKTYIYTEATDRASNNTTENNENNEDVELSRSTTEAADADAVKENAVRRSRRTSRKRPKNRHNTSDLPVPPKRAKTTVRTDLQDDLPSNNTTVNNANNKDVDLSRSNRGAADTGAVKEKPVRRSTRKSRKTTETHHNTSELPATEVLQDLPSNNTTENNENKTDIDLSWGNTEAADTDVIDIITIRRRKRPGKDSHNVLGKDQMIFVKIEDGGICEDSNGFDGDDCHLEDEDQELTGFDGDDRHLEDGDQELTGIDGDDRHLEDGDQEQTGFNGNDRHLEDGDQELTTEPPEPEPEQPKSKIEKLTKVRKKRDKTKEKVKTKVKAKKPEDFDESDEEPLKKKMPKDTEVKVKKARRKKTEAGAGSTGARRLAALGLPPGNVEMVSLTWEQVEEERAKARASEAYTRHEFRCERCVVGFNHSAKLSEHMQKHEPAAGEPICHVCTVACRNAHALAAHLRRHRTRWRCVFCSSLWSRAAVAADHAARQHRAPAAVHRCRCGHQESSLGKLRHHMKSHLERQKCELCEKTFRDRASLRSHMFIHSGEKEHACPVCDKKFLFKRLMELHAITHDASQLLYCHQCDMNFKNRMSFYQHMKYNLKHIDPAKLKHTCPICDKRFSKATRLSEHNVAVHLREAPIRCTEPGCRFACASKPVLRTHKRMAHRGAKDKRNHVCHHCGKTYATKKSLEGHMRSHTGERPYRCVACDARFGYHAALYNHMKIVHHERKTNRKRSAPVAPPESAADTTAVGPPLPDPPGPAIPPAALPIGPPAGPTTAPHWLTEACASRPVFRTHARVPPRGAKDKRYVCHHCGKAYASKKWLEGHMRSHTDNHTRMVHRARKACAPRPVLRTHARVPPRGAKDKRNYVCHHCGKAYASKKWLEGHMRSHTDNHTRMVHRERKACASRPVLRTHARVPPRGAKDKRNYVCHHCGKAYASKKWLEGHMRSHTDEHTRMVHRERKSTRKRSARVAPPKSAADSTAAGPPLPGPPAGAPSQTPELLWNLNLTEVSHPQG